MASAFYITAKGVSVFGGDSLEACLAYASSMLKAEKVYLLAVPEA